MTWLSNGGADSSDPAWQPGAGPPTDPGPGCGGTPRPPTHDIDVSALRPPKGFTRYWMGPQYGKVLLSVLLRSGMLYADCASYRAADCRERIELQNASICRRRPFSYGRSRHFKYRGALAVWYPGAEAWDIYTGRTAITIFGVRGRPRDIKPVIRALRPVPAGPPPKDTRLPAPATKHCR
jgi:hypothetical protein